MLHVASGAGGEVNFIGVCCIFAVDPFMSFYNREFVDSLNRDVEYINGRGEDLPFDDCSFDLAISWNSLDHCEFPSKVLREISRVLKHQGIPYLGIHVKSEYGHLAFEMIKKIRTQTGYC